MYMHICNYYYVHGDGDMFLLYASHMSDTLAMYMHICHNPHPIQNIRGILLLNPNPTEFLPSSKPNKIWPKFFSY